MAPKITPPPVSESENGRNARMAWWREAKFGMFVHYGLYSTLEGEFEGRAVAKDGAEWYQERSGMDSQTYESKTRKLWSPKEDAPKKWADLAKSMGCQYMVVTTKHHEGFPLFKTSKTAFNSVDFCGRDLVAEYAEAARSNGLKVGFYHSLIDWKHSQYDYRLAEGLPFPKDELKRVEGSVRNHQEYLEYLHGQVTEELLSNYGVVDIMWFDYSSEEFDGEEAWKATQLMTKIKVKQPHIIINNRLFRRPEGGFSGPNVDDFTTEMDPRYGDFITPEQSVPAGGMKSDWEACVTLNDNWGYSKFDTNWKTATQVIQMLCDTVSKGGNFLLNVGPRADGSVPQPCLDILTEVGSWMQLHSEAIIGTSASPIAEKFEWGRLTQTKEAVYVHVFDRPALGSITIPVRGHECAFLTGEPVQFTSHGDEVTLTLPQKLPNAHCSVVKLLKAAS